MRQNQPRSLRTNILAVVVLASGLAIGLFTAAVTYLDMRSFISQVDDRLATLAEVIGQNSTAALEFSDPRGANEILSALNREPQVVSACLYTTTGALFSEYEVSPTALRCSDRAGFHAQLGSRYRRVVRPIRHAYEDIGSIELTAEMKDLEQHKNRMLLIASALALASLLIAALSGVFLQRRISQPVVRLAGAMSQVTRDGSLDARVSVDGAREIAQLASGFNRMLVELERRNQIARQAQLQLLEQARTDALTGLPNRRHLAEQLERELARFKQEKWLMALLYIDLDGFKLVNDSLGHAVGDLLLCEVASRLRSRLRSTDILARVGGDEFTLILTGLESENDAMTVANGLIQCLSSPFEIEGNRITVGASIGISTRLPSAIDDLDMLKQADSAMYAAKRAGKNRAVHFKPELSRLARERLTLEGDLRGAIERGEIYVEYQPEWNAASGRLIRFEALARWRHSHLGEIPPGDFIPIAEESGLIHELGRFIMERACLECLEWQKLSHSPVEVAVNVSSLQFASEGFVEEVASILARTGLKPKLLQIELTESAMLGSASHSAEQMKTLREIGVTFAIDDFGTGYSCLGYLPTLPFSALKIDRTFIRRLETGPEVVTMIRSVIELAQKMGLRVVVEGIEEPSQLRAVREMGADELQGYLLGLPSDTPRIQFSEFLRGVAKAVDLPHANGLAQLKLDESTRVPHP